MWSIHTMEYYSALERNEVLIYMLKYGWTLETLSSTGFSLSALGWLQRAGLTVLIRCGQNLSEPLLRTQGPNTLKNGSWHLIFDIIAKPLCAPLTFGGPRIQAKNTNKGPHITCRKILNYKSRQQTIKIVLSLTLTTIIYNKKSNENVSSDGFYTFESQHNIKEDWI